MSKSTTVKPAATVETFDFTIERRPAARKPWKATKHTVNAKTANDALRQFGLRDAFASPRVKVAKGGKTGRQYRAVRSVISGK